MNKIKTLKSLKSFKKNLNMYGYLFIVPFFTTFLIFQLYPMFNTISLSFTNLAGFASKGDFIFVDNYIKLLQDPIFLETISNTFIIWIINFIPQILIALTFAAWFTNSKMKCVGTFKVIFYMPNIITAASLAVLFSSLGSHPYGAIDVLFTKLGMPHEFNIFLSEWGSRIYISFIQFLMWFGSTMIIFVAGMLGISPEYYEAAAVDGATRTQAFFRITLPLIKPIMLYVLVTSLIGGLQIFDIPYLLNGGGPRNATNTMASFIYTMAFKGTQNYGMAAAASVILFFISMVISIAMFKVLAPKKS